MCNQVVVQSQRLEITGVPRFCGTSSEERAVLIELLGLCARKGNEDGHEDIAARKPRG